MNYSLSETHRRMWPIYISRRLQLTRNVIKTSKNCSDDVISCDPTAVYELDYTDLHEEYKQY